MAETEALCYHCLKMQPIKKFLSYNGRIYKFGKIPVCNDCLNNLFEDYVVAYKGDYKQAIRRLCMNFDLYYSDGIYVSSIRNGEFSLNEYIKKLNINPNKNRTFDTSLKEGINFISGEFVSTAGADGKGKASLQQKLAKDLQDTPPDVIKRWGVGYQPVDYETLENHYSYLKKANPHCDSNQEIFINDLCILKMQQQRATREGKIDDLIKLTDAYRKTFSQAGLKTSQDSDSSEDDCWGEWIRRVEEYTPADYYRNKELFKDADGVKDYFSRFVLRPLKNLITGQDERDKEFSVPEDGE